MSGSGVAGSSSSLSSSSSSRASSSSIIPASERKTIQTIREITGKQHSDDDIFSLLQDCSMDPNETAQKLLYLDTFHEVKRKRERRKESSVPVTHGRGVRGGRGNYFSNSIFSDADIGRNGAPRRENRVNQVAERGSMPSLPVSQQTKINAVPHVTKTSAAIRNGPSNLSNGSSSNEHGPQVSVVNEPKNSSAVDVNKLGTATLRPTIAEQPPSMPAHSFSSVVRNEREKSTSSTNFSVSGVYSSASDPVLAPPLSRHPVAVGTIKREVGSQRKAAEPNNFQENKLVSPDGGSELSESEKAASGTLKSVNKKKSPKKSKEVEKNQPSESLQSSSASAHVSSLAVGSPEESVVPLKVVTSEAATVTVKANSQLLPESNVPDDQHVTFPNHFQVPEAFKNGLTFGSFDANFGPEINHVDGTGGDINTHAVESSQGIDETAGEPSPSIQSVSSTAQGENPDYPQSTPLVLENVPPSEDNISSGADLKSDQSKQDMLLLPEGHQNPTVQNLPNYSFGFISALPGSHFVQLEGSETQSGNPPPSSSSSQTPAVQTASTSPHPVTLFRQPYPPNYFPYGPYLSPYFMPPMHQFLSPNGLPQQPSSGNLYLPPVATAPAVKFPLPQFKPGTNAANPPHIGIPSGYASYNSSPVGFNSVPAMTSGSSTSNEDLLASQLKESHIYTTRPPSEGSALWIPDLSSLQVSSLYNLPLQGQHLAFSPAQAGHGAFAGIYQPAQSMAAPTNANALLQQSQAMAAAVETVVPPSVGTYQQPQLAQMNWNTKY